MTVVVVMVVAAAAAGPVARMLAVTATLKRGSTRAGPGENNEQGRVGHRRFELQRGYMGREGGGSQHQAPMSVGMEMRSMSIDTMSDRFCAFASPSATACACWEGARRGESNEEPSCSLGGGPHVTHSSSSSAGGGGDGDGDGCRLLL